MKRNADARSIADDLLRLSDEFALAAEERVRLEDEFLKAQMEVENYDSEMCDGISRDPESFGCAPGEKMQWYRVMSASRSTAEYRRLKEAEAEARKAFKEAEAKERSILVGIDCRRSAIAAFSAGSFSH